ncbi:MAG: hypothetical protein IPG74_18035 [Flavobacteriales bacterium]|nr:hypothetical protein [Flavobacteriales bacterium]MBK7555661.1 hypothetical protein [Flavobacteriales bacterium]MBK9195341.1 hypothetical protein [Flavobacteriales bacterium]
MVSRNLLLPALALSALLLTSAPVNAVEAGAEGATVRVECTRSSSLINISILHERRIGKVKITVCDANGKVFYIEEGKALKNELVRRIDKQGMTKGEMTLTVEAHDFRIEQRFLVQ